MDFNAAKKYILHRLETELHSNLYYHGIHHTIDVYEATIKLAELEKLNEEETIIVKTAALFHDAGFLFRYEHNEELAVDLVEKILPSFNYNNNAIKTIGQIILTTRVAARPTTTLEKIMSDADFDYLGREDVFKIAATLYQELIEFGVYFSPEEWNILQYKFLKKHQYYTDSAIKLRKDKKKEYLNYIKSIIK
jgi:HD superfamily phosphodiesterase